MCRDCIKIRPSPLQLTDASAARFTVVLEATSRPMLHFDSTYLLQAGNITFEVSASSTFSARYAYGPAINSSISGLNYLTSRTFQNISCATVMMNSSGGLDTYLFTTQAFLDWQAAFNK